MSAINYKSPWYDECIASGLAFMPIRRAYEIKSHIQTETKIPRFSLGKTLWLGAKAAPLTGSMIGLQRIAQIAMDSAMRPPTGFFERFSRALLTATVVGVVSTPLFSIFTGMTRGLGWSESLKALCMKQVGASSVIEVGFLFGMEAADTMSSLFRQKIADNKVVDYGAAFVSGSLGGALGHGGDTAFTRWQAKMQVTVSHLPKGGMYRIPALGAYACFYKGIKELLAYIQSNKTTNLKR